MADSRAAMARAAAALHRHPSRRLAVVGVTGTNGKTTTTHLLKAVLEADGREAEVIGTLSGPRTTPEATELQAALAAAADRGVGAVALEVSSHALALHRVDAIRFSVAVFTNLSPEHLDFHDGMDDYFAAKAALFSPERARVAVVNADDPWGRKLLAAARLPDPLVLPGRRGRARTGARRGPVPVGRAPGVAAPGGDVQRVQRPGRGHRRPRARRRRRRPWRKGCRPPWSCPAGSSPSTGASRSGWWSTTPTRPPAWRRACRRPGSWPVMAAG